MAKGVGAFEKYDKFRNDDPIARLIVHYFHPCDFLYRDYQRVSRALAKQKMRTRWRASQETAYMRLWLSTLYVVAEGYQDLKLTDPALEILLADEYLASLRQFRNGTLHYQRDPRKQVQFITHERFVWAESLHKAFDRFFRDYRIEVAVENALADHHNTESNSN